MEDTTPVFRNMSITLAQLKACVGMTNKQAYQSLGVEKSKFYLTIKKLKLGYLFHSMASPTYFIGELMVTFDQARACEGLTIREAAEKVGSSYSSFKRSAESNKMMHLFKKGHSKKEKMKKEDGRRKKEEHLGPKLEDEYVTCYRQGCNEKIHVEVWPGEKPSKYQHCPSHKPR